MMHTHVDDDDAGYLYKIVQFNVTIISKCQIKNMSTCHYKLQGHIYLYYQWHCVQKSGVDCKILDWLGLQHEMS